ncbi:amidophosphoribosyltransferase [Archaeoglobus sulfaticallidus PM70-1]|uniref:Amidophosphoribosyltransferase n=1 Tax=Archaeoglobus sulfaticallidus PM70-1 TaxID=387631 RepID=N0BHG7_9EURY|nr:amidophosphoribosyltransferase [Archaeoglobus sulfaticallidus]AGK61762.1 amidophosphoribosyltransferase [Archaeoglobus sulfaticallidus PM70-1]
MCGIVGVFCNDVDLTPHITYYALFSLQHRGQESAGMAVSGVGVNLYKDMGLVSEVFSNKILSMLKGNSSIGHVRYSTTGQSRIENAQPLAVKSRYGSIAVAHNGNLVNYRELRKELEIDGKVFHTDSDTEVIVYLLSSYLLDNDLETALSMLTKKLMGSFTLTLLLNDMVVGYRDPMGFKPLCVGEGEFGYIIASESCAIDSVGAELIRDVRPGEAVIIEDGDLRFEKIAGSDKKCVCVFEYIYFARPDSVIDGRNVYRVRYNIGRTLAKESPAEVDLVSPVPDSGTTSSIGYAHESGKPYLEALIKNRYVGRTFIIPGQENRELSVKLKMNVLRDNVNGKRVLLIDDSIVRGTTSRKIVELVRKAGAKEIHFRVGSPPIVSPCYFGIDMSTREELIASEKSVEDIRRDIMADSLAYLSLEGLLDSVGIRREDLCLACLTSRYPVPVECAMKC